MARVAARVSDKRVLKLIRAFLNVGVMEDGLVRPVDEGTPQGGPLSPILSNLVLDDLDKELARRGHRFCRYADDCNIYVRSHRAGERVMASVSRFLTNRLRLKVNEAKSAVARPEERKFLGFSISNDGSERRITPKALDKFKGRIRDMTRRTRGFSLQQLIKELKPYIMGWRGYFGFCRTPRVLTNFEAWIRRRLRLYLWRQWRTRQNRFAELRRHGLAKFPAAVAAGSPTGLWRMSGHPAVQQALRNNYFKSLGLPRSLRPPKPNSVEPPWYGPVCPVVWGGVASRGVPLSRSYVNSSRAECANTGHSPTARRTGQSTLGGPTGLAQWTGRRRGKAVFGRRHRLRRVRSFIECNGSLESRCPLMSLAAPPQIDDTTPRSAFLTSRGSAALLAAKSAQPDTGSRDAIPCGIPSCVCRPLQARRWMGKT